MANDRVNTIVYCDVEVMIPILFKPWLPLCRHHAHTIAHFKRLLLIWTGGTSPLSYSIP